MIPKLEETPLFQCGKMFGAPGGGRKVNEIHIINFGPVRKAATDVDSRMQILIGTQASVLLSKNQRLHIRFPDGCEPVYRQSQKRIFQ